MRAEERVSDRECERQQRWVRGDDRGSADRGESASTDDELYLSWG